MSGLRAEGLLVTYPGLGRPAVDHANFTVDSREIVGLVGASGSGKSSLLAAVAGVLPLAGGSLSWDEVDLVKVPVHRRGFGLMFQEGQLFPHRDVAGNIRFGLEMAHVDKDTARARVASLLETVGLEGLGHRRVDELSGGQRQRVALARALAPGPRLLMLDEPLAQLDMTLRRRLASDIAATLRAEGVTGLVVSHDPEDIALMCDRAFRMTDGRIEPIA